MKEIIYREVDELMLLEDNPRKISVEQMERLKDSIDKNPDYFECRPVILSDRTGDKIAAMTLEANFNIPQIVELCKKMKVEHKYRTRAEWIKLGAKFVKGYQLRYIYFIDKSYRKRLTVPEIPFSRIDEMGAGMYKGENVTRAERNVECEAQKKKEESV